MIRFNKITIRNFMSIEFIELYFKKGVFSFSAENGTGKTNVLLALLQGLYNKNLKTDTDKLEETYNKYTKKPYHITIEFSILEDNYIIDNNRPKNNIFIYRNAEDITPKGIKNQLGLIEKIIGMDYNVFSSFYYLSVNTLQNIFDISNKENLVYKFFDMDTLKFIEKKLKEQLKELKFDKQSYLINIKSIEKQLTLLTSFKKVDITKLSLEKQMLNESLVKLQEEEKFKKLKILENKLQKMLLEIQKENLILVELTTDFKVKNELLNKFKKGTCPLCNSNTKNINSDLDNTLKTLENKIKKQKITLENINSQKITLENIKITLENEFNTKKKSILGKINYINNQIVIYEKDKENFDSLSSNIEKLEKEKELFITKYKEATDKISFIEVSNTVLKSNALLKDYLINFILLLNNKIQEINNKIDFNINIICYQDKSKIKFKFKTDDVEKSLNNLSSGEKTRVALILLFAILEVLQTLSNNSIDILVLDELLGVLDSKGVELLKILLEIKRENSTTFLVQHHKEIDDKFFDKIYHFKKINNLTQIKG